MVMMFYILERIDIPQQTSIPQHYGKPFEFLDHSFQLENQTEYMKLRD
jgi:hypothetical protein